MYSLFSTVYERLNRFLTTKALFVSNVAAGAMSARITGDLIAFSFQNVNEKYPTLLIMNDDTTGQRTETGYFSSEKIDILSIDIDNGVVYFKSPVQNNWTVAKHSFIIRAPGGVNVQRVVRGNLTVVNQFPTVCVVPTSKDNQWTALQVTTEKNNFDIIAYIERGNTEQGQIDLMNLMDSIEWIMMSNLHLQVAGGIENYEVTSNAMVTNVEYGQTAKGNEFLKTGKLTWFGEICVARDYVYKEQIYKQK